MHKTLSPEDWEAQGYKRFNSAIKPHAVFGLRKRFDDDEGKRYYITVWVYDNTPYMGKYTGYDRWSFQPEVQFNANNTTFDVQYFHRNSVQWGVTSIEQVEAFFHKMWKDMACDYYEKLEH